MIWKFNCGCRNQEIKKGLLQNRNSPLQLVKQDLLTVVPICSLPRRFSRSRLRRGIRNDKSLDSVVVIYNRKAPSVSLRGAIVTKQSVILKNNPSSSNELEGFICWCLDYRYDLIGSLWKLCESRQF